MEKDEIVERLKGIQRKFVLANSRDDVALTEAIRMLEANNYIEDDWDMK